MRVKFKSNKLIKFKTFEEVLKDNQINYKKISKNDNLRNNIISKNNKSKYYKIILVNFINRFNKR
jgi:hypothetical protein